MKALIVDAEEIYRVSLKEIVSVSGAFTSIIEADNEHDFLTHTAKERQLDLIIIHPKSLGQGGDSFLSLAQRLYPTASIIAFENTRDSSMPINSDNPNVVKLLRNASIEKVYHTIRQLMNIDQSKSRAEEVGAPNIRIAIDDAQPKSAITLCSDADLDRLSFRQRQILEMAADGLPNKEIAARLTIAEGTVKAHMHAIFKVLGVSNRTQAVIRFGAVGKHSSYTVNQRAVATSALQ